MHLAVDPNVHLVDVPTPNDGNPASDLPAGAGYPQAKHRAKSIPPQPHGLVTQIDPALVQQIFDVPQRQRKTNIHQDHEPDHFR